jgi:hypothetical protein
MTSERDCQIKVWLMIDGFHAARKGLFRLNPLPTSTLKSRGGGHGNQTRPFCQTPSTTQG